MSCFNYTRLHAWTIVDWQVSQRESERKSDWEREEERERERESEISYVRLTGHRFTLLAFHWTLQHQKPLEWTPEQAVRHYFTQVSSVWTVIPPVGDLCIVRSEGYTFSLHFLEHRQQMKMNQFNSEGAASSFTLSLSLSFALCCFGLCSFLFSLPPLALSFAAATVPIEELGKLQFQEPAMGQ